MKSLAISFALLVLVGCAATSHEPTAGGAELRAGAGTTIVAIDGKKVPSGEVMNQAEQIVRTSAGARKLNVYTSGGHGSGEWTVPVTLEAGHVYRIGPASATALSLRIVDQTTNTIIAGPGVPPVSSAPRLSPQSVRP